MKYYILILITLSLNFYCQASPNEIDCDKYADDYIPKDLNDALDFFDCVWSEEDKEKFRNLEEQFAGIGMGMLGLSIRNSWGFWEKKYRLYRFFKSHGITHPDDMSSIIITSLHRKLNGKEIEFESQIQYFLDYWKPSIIFYKESKKRAYKIYRNYNIGDTLSIFVEVVDGLATRRAGPNPEWKFDVKEDLKIDAVLLNKEIIRKRSDVKFKVRIINLNRDKDANTIWGDIQRNDTIETEIRHLRIEKY